MLNTLLVVWTGLVVVLMLVSAYWMRPFAPEDELNNGFALFLVGAVLLGGSLVLWRRLQDDSTNEKPPVSKPNFVPIHTGMAFIGIVCLAILTQINLLHPVTDDRSPLFFLRGLSIHVQVALFVLGCLFVTWGLIGWTTTPFELHMANASYNLALDCGCGIGLATVEFGRLDSSLFG